MVSEYLRQRFPNGQNAMEPKAPQEEKVRRSELDTAFDVSREGRWMVVQSMSTTPWGYELWDPTRASLDGGTFGFPVVVDLP